MARKAAKGSPRIYFTKETEEYINKYNTSEDSEERNRIFTNHIYFPFYKLAENIIHTFKFYHTDLETVEDLKLDIVTMLLQDKIHLFDPTRGTKAFSYFGTIVKRWLIANSKKNLRKQSKQFRLIESEDNTEERSQDIVETEEMLSLSSFINKWIESVQSELSDLFKKEEDIRIAEALLQVFSDRKKLNLIGKKAIYVYVRELTGYSTVQISGVLKILRENFYRKYRYKLNREELDLDYGIYEDPANYS